MGGTKNLTLGANALTKEIMNSRMEIMLTKYNIKNKIRRTKFSYKTGCNHRVNITTYFENLII